VADGSAPPPPAVGRFAGSSGGYRALGPVYSRQAALAHTLVCASRSCRAKRRLGLVAWRCWQSVCHYIIETASPLLPTSVIPAVPACLKKNLSTCPTPFTLGLLRLRLSVGLHTSARRQDNACTRSRTANPVIRRDRESALSSARLHLIVTQTTSLSISERRVQSKTV
jgi:hypothetical protein